MRQETHFRLRLSTAGDAIRRKRDHAKLVAAGRHLRVLRGPAAAGFLPGRIEGVEPIAKAKCRGVPEARRRVVELKIAATRSRLDETGGQLLPAVHEHALDERRRRSLPSDRLGRIDEDRAAPRGEPQAPVARLPCRGLAVADAGAALHAVADVVENEGQRALVPVGQRLESVAVDADHAAIAGEP
jgi:hypothetical protein